MVNSPNALPKCLPFLALSATFLLSACGGGGSSSTPAAGTPLSNDTTVPVVNLAVTPVRIAAGAGYSLVVLSGGSVQTLGSGMHGVSTGLASSKAVGTALWADGQDASFAIDASGVVRAWGVDAANTLTSTPSLSTTLGKTVAVRGCGTGKSAVVYALRSDGTVWATPATGLTSSGTAIAVSGLGQVQALSDGADQSCSGMLAILKDGTVWKMTATNATADSSVAPDRVTTTQIAGLTKAVQASCIDGNCLAVQSDGSVWSWGSNEKGQLGQGNKDAVSVPTQVTGLPSSKKVIVSADGAAYAVTTSGVLYSWGLGAMNRALIPTKTLDFSTNATTVADVAVSPEANGHTLVLLANGSVFGWGNNARGQLGFASPTTVWVPTQVPDLTVN